MPLLSSLLLILQKNGEENLTENPRLPDVNSFLHTHQLSNFGQLKFYVLFFPKNCLTWLLIGLNELIQIKGLEQCLGQCVHSINISNYSITKVEISITIALFEQIYRLMTNF